MPRKRIQPPGAASTKSAQLKPVVDALDSPTSYFGGMPLGGIGAGKAEFCPDGHFRNLMITNNWDAIVQEDMPVRNIAAKNRGLIGAFFGAYTPHSGFRFLQTEKEETLQSILPTENRSAKEAARYLRTGELSFDSRYPRLRAEYAGFGAVSIALEAVSPLILDDDGACEYKDSCMPAAGFSFTVHNRGRKPTPVAVVFSWPNLIGLGGSPNLLIEDRRGNAIAMAESGGLLGLSYYSKVPKADAGVQGECLTAAPKQAGVEITTMWGLPNFLDTRVWRPALAKQVESDQRLPNAEYVPGTCGAAETSFGAVCQTVRLEPGEKRELRFVLSWFFPHYIGDHVRRPDYGHAYQRWFSNAFQVSDYFLGNWDRLLAGTRAWQDHLASSSLPEWFQVKLANDLFPFSSCSVYTGDLRYTVNESPMCMGGCHGTIDQRTCGQAAVLMAFPAMARSEIQMFADQQVAPSSPQRFGPHWNPDTASYDPAMNLDHAGAIQHEVGWDHLEGGRMGEVLGNLCWRSITWPDLTSSFVFQVYLHAAWTGDRGFLANNYARIKAALEFQDRLDLDRDGIPEIWGQGSSTFDSRHFPYYGASSFIGTLSLAACRIGARCATLLDDPGFAEYCNERAERIRQTLENKIYRPSLGHFLLWRDPSHRKWRNTPRAHEAESDNCFAHQLAGQWMAHVLGLGYLLDPDKVRSAMREITRRNDKPFKGGVANEVSREQKMDVASWPHYIHCYYTANALYSGTEVDTAFAAEKKIADASLASASSYWNPLYWTGKNLEVPASGYWYMTAPSTWFLLPALAGVAMDRLAGELTIAPNIPRALGARPEIPLFLPGMWAKVSRVDAARTQTLAMTIARHHGAQHVFNTIRLRIPAACRNPARLKIRVTTTHSAEQEFEIPHEARDESRMFTVSCPVTFAGAGDSLQIRMSW